MAIAGDESRAKTIAAKYFMDGIFGARKRHFLLRDRFAFRHPPNRGWSASAGVAFGQLAEAEGGEGRRAKPDDDCAGTKNDAPDCCVCRWIAEYDRSRKLPLARSERDPTADRAKADENAQPDQILHGAQPERRAGRQVAAIIGVAEHLD